MKIKITGKELLYFNLPMIAGGAMNMLAGNYLMKYATDILLIAPSAMGLIFLITRIWDALNDPLIGHWSDNTRSSFGRRKIWMAVSIIPMIVLFYFLWVSPFEEYKQQWLMIAMLFFYTAFTGFFVPHYSMAAELSSHYHTRNKIYGYRALAENIGVFIGVAVIAMLANKATAYSNASMIMLLISVFTLFSFIPLLYTFKENKITHASKGSLIQNFIDIFKNKHARIVLMTGFFSQLGATFVFTITLYYTEYVLKRPQDGSLVIGLFMISATLSIPLWIRVLKAVEKKSLWIISYLVIAASFLLTLFINSDNYFILYVLTIFSGLAAGAALMIHPAALADTIDYDKYHTEKKREGVYFALFTFLNKSSMGVAGLLIGVVLAFARFTPNQDQAPFSVLIIKLAYALLPFFSFIIAAFVVSRYKFLKSDHASTIDAGY